MSLTNHLARFLPSHVYCLVSEAHSVAALLSAVTAAYPSYCLEREETERKISNIKTHPPISPQSGNTALYAETNGSRVSLLVEHNKCNEI